MENRIAQCQRVKITILDGSLPIQIDGETRIQEPGVINISFKNSLFFLHKPTEQDNSHYKNAL
ncbi:hypothetical protein MXB_2083 [Myxobolus squamalis]|nr:hypothetical protein MXB_2083 [Myxobolus squamalis]